MIRKYSMLAIIMLVVLVIPLSAQAPLLKFAAAGDCHVHDAASRDALKAFFNDAAANGCQFAILLGDLVNSGSVVDEWEFFKQGIGASPIPVKFVPGNHDPGMPDNGGTYQVDKEWHKNYAYFTKYTGSPVNVTYGVGPAWFIHTDVAEKKTFVDTVGHDVLAPFIQRQLSEIDAQSKYPFVFVATHNPYRDTLFFPEEENSNFTSRHFMDPFKPVIWLSGHTHMPTSVVMSGLKENVVDCNIGTTGEHTYAFISLYSNYAVIESRGPQGDTIRYRIDMDRAAWRARLSSVIVLNSSPVKPENEVAKKK